MENASKALVMAAGVLIGVLVLSLIIYLYTYFGSQSQKFTEIINQRQLTSYNAQYTVFDGRKDLSVYDVVSIINKAYKNNEEHKDEDVSTYENEYQVKVLVNGIDYAKVEQSTSDLSDNIIELIENNYETKYQCRIFNYNGNGRVSDVRINKNNND